MDNKSNDPRKNPNRPNMIISSGMLIEKFGGLESLAQSLGTDLKKGLDKSQINEQRR